MQVDLLNGIYVDAAPDMRTSYPRNLVPVVKKTGIAQNYLKPADGIAAWGAGGPGIGRGGINWNGTIYRAMGTKLCSISSGGAITELGEIGGFSVATLDYGFDRLAIASAGHLFYWDGAALTQVTDPDLGVVNDLKWIAGYYATTDGTYIVVTNLADPMTVSPFKYGSAEADPDKIVALDSLRNELYAFGRYTIEVFENIGGDFFPFSRIAGALVPKGAIGTHAYCSIGNTFIFLGSGRDEAPAVYLMLPGDTQKLSTREIDRILTGYTEAELSVSVMESIVDKNQQLVLLHLPDRTLAYDTIASRLLGESIWYTLDSGTIAPAQYRGRNFVWAYDRWCCEDPTTAALGQLTDTVSTHYGAAIGWDFGTTMLYNDGNDAILLDLELVALPGRVPLGAAPQVWTSHSFDGETWSAERMIAAGEQGQRAKRLAWRNAGRIRNYRMQRFRGTSDAHLPLLRLEAKTEPLFTRAGRPG